MIPPLVAVTPGDHGVSHELISLLEAMAGAGLEMAILREPHLGERAYVALARAVAQLLPAVVLHGKHPDALEIAARAGFGLHLPAGADLHAARRRVRGLLGASCHSPLEVAAARSARCDYVILSPIFSPTSKPGDSREPLGLAVLAEVCAAFDLPIAALGGIEPGRVAACRDAGAAAVAMLGGLFPPDASPESSAAAVLACRAAWAS